MSSSESETSCSSREKIRTQDKRKKYSKVKEYNIKWENEAEFSSWISKSKKRSCYFYCKICNCSRKAGRSEIIKHSKSEKHIIKARRLKKQKTINESLAHSQSHSLEVNTKEIEIILCNFLVEHNLPFELIDHLCKLMKRICKFPQKAIENTKCHRDKATMIVKNVIGAVNKN